MAPECIAVVAVALPRSRDRASRDSDGQGADHALVRRRRRRSRRETDPDRPRVHRGLRRRSGKNRRGSLPRPTDVVSWRHRVEVAAIEGRPQYQIASQTEDRIKTLSFTIQTEAVIIAAMGAGLPFQEKKILVKA